MPHAVAESPPNAVEHHVICLACREAETSGLVLRGRANPHCWGNCIAFCDAFAVRFTVCYYTTWCKLGQKDNLVLHRESEQCCFTTFWARELTLPQRERVSKSGPASVALAGCCSTACASDSCQAVAGWDPAQLQRHVGLSSDTSLCWAGIWMISLPVISKVTNWCLQH